MPNQTQTARDVKKFTFDLSNELVDELRYAQYILRTTTLSETVRLCIAAGAKSIIDDIDPERKGQVHGR